MNHPTPGPLPEAHQFAPMGRRPFAPPPMPPGMSPPPGVKIENGRPVPKWGDLADAPFHAATDDRISSLLQRVRVSTIPFGLSEMSGDWGIALPPIPCAYVAVTEGRVCLRADRAGPFELREGECAIVCQPSGLSISDSPESPVVSAMRAMTPGHLRSHTGLKMGSGEVRARFAAGPLIFDSGVGGPLRSALPQVVALCAGEGGTPHDERLVRGVVSLLALVRSTNTPGAGALTNQLVTILVIEAMRSYLALPQTALEPWAGALFDEHLGPMLSLLHSSPARPWTLQEMANESRLSRTVFAEKFLKVVGVPPATYVRNFRLDMAKDLLRGSDADVRSIARRVGYTSEAAFCNVFKKSSGLTPTEYRDQARVGPAGGSAAVGMMGPRP